MFLCLSIFFHFPLSLSLFFLYPYHTCTSYSGYNNNNNSVLATYKAIGRPVLVYADQYGLLPSAIHNGLNYSHHRTATGCHVMSHEHHLHHETKMLTVRDHCTLLTRHTYVHTYIFGATPVYRVRPRYCFSKLCSV